VLFRSPWDAFFLCGMAIQVSTRTDVVQPAQVR
jgi:hypothetical protein